MSCISYVRRFISTLLQGQIFTTRDCLNLGIRANIDKALQKLVRTGFIIRLARGVFVRNLGITTFPTALEMARIKAKAFGKEVRIHAADTAAASGITDFSYAEDTFYVDGSTSSFKYEGRRINLKKCSKKRILMEDSKAGLAIRALSALGRRYFRYWHIDIISPYWDSNRVEKKKIYLSKAWMPAWLGDLFPPTTYLGPQPNWAPVKARPQMVRDSEFGIYRPFWHVDFEMPGLIRSS